MQARPKDRRRARARASDLSGCDCALHQVRPSGVTGRFRRGFEIGRHHFFAGAQIGQEIFVILPRKVREPPFVGGKSDKAAIKFGYFAAKPCPRTGFDRGQDITDGCGIVLHGRGQGDIFPLLLRNADVIIRANEPVAGCGGGCGGRIATGENDLCAGAIPIVCGQFCVILGIKIVAIGVTQTDIFTGEIGSCGIRALHKAIAIADHRRNCHISEEAKLLINPPQRRRIRQDSPPLFR